MNSNTISSIKLQIWLSQRDLMKMGNPATIAGPRTGVYCVHQLGSSRFLFVYITHALLQSSYRQDVYALKQPYDGKCEDCAQLCKLGRCLAKATMCRHQHNIDSTWPQHRWPVSEIWQTWRHGHNIDGQSVRHACYYTTWFGNLNPLGPFMGPPGFEHLL